MTPKTDSVAVLRDLRRYCDHFRMEAYLPALDAAIAALSAPGGVGDAVTEEMVSRACIAHDPRYYVVSEDTRCDMRERMRAALQAARAARTGKGEA